MTEIICAPMMESLSPVWAVSDLALIPILSSVLSELFWYSPGSPEARCRGAQLASIRQMRRQVSRGSAGEYQADEQAGVARLRWRVSGR